MSKGLLNAIIVCGVFTALGSTGAHAQMSTSNCMSMGPNMVHCDTMDMTPPASPPAYPSNDSGALLGKAVRNLILGNQERAFRVKIGKMLADGDCQGAARVAFESGRLEMGEAVSASCQQQRPTAIGASSAGSFESQTPPAQASTGCTSEKMRYAQASGIDCHSLGGSWP